MRRTLQLALFALASACGGQGEDAPPIETGIPLGTWVHALVTERMTDEAEPDTVEDKVIIDTEDPAAFDVYVP